MLTSLITFLIVGLIAGWLAGRVMKAYGFIGSVIMAFVGALVLLYLLRMVRKT
jgi:uncharacterized membrane protein YeaQ/YmgE (transglycosylase-associated protein family)